MNNLTFKLKNVVSKKICSDVSEFLEEQLMFSDLTSDYDKQHTCEYIGYWLDMLIDDGKITRHFVQITGPHFVEYGLYEYVMSVTYKQKNCINDTTIALHVSIFDVQMLLDLED